MKVYLINPSIEVNPDDIANDMFEVYFEEYQYDCDDNHKKIYNALCVISEGQYCRDTLDYDPTFWDSDDCDVYQLSDLVKDDQIKLVQSSFRTFIKLVEKYGLEE